MKKFLFMMALVILMVMPPTTTSATTSRASETPPDTISLADFGNQEHFAAANCVDIFDFLIPVVLPGGAGTNLALDIQFMESDVSSVLNMISVEDNYNGSKNVVSRADSIATLRASAYDRARSRVSTSSLSEHTTANTPNAEVPEVASRTEIVASR